MHGDDAGQPGFVRLCRAHWPLVVMAGRPPVRTVISMTEASKLAKHYPPALAVGLALTVLAACGSRASSGSSPVTATTSINQPPQLVQVSHDQVEVFASHDLGRSWSAPMVATVSSSASYFQPQLAVDGGGAVGLEAFELTGGRVQLLLWVSTSKGSAFGTPRPVTPRPGFDPALGLSVGSGPSTEHWIGDYQGLAAGASAFHPLWNDTRTGQMELFTATMAPG